MENAQTVEPVYKTIKSLVFVLPFPSPFRLHECFGDYQHILKLSSGQSNKDWVPHVTVRSDTARIGMCTCYCRYKCSVLQLVWSFDLPEGWDGPSFIFIYLFIASYVHCNRVEIIQSRKRPENNINVRVFLFWKVASYSLFVLFCIH